VKQENDKLDDNIQSILIASENPPGLKQRHYRVATYGQFLKMMEAMVKSPVLMDSAGVFSNPLKNLELHYQDDLAVGLFKSWAIIGDILSFYQERIANEGYLATARYSDSVLELVRTIGYRPQPGLAAGTFLSFYAIQPNRTGGPVTVPAGTLVQAIPGKDNKSIGFETEREIEVRAEWNRMGLFIETYGQTVTVGADTPFLDLDGSLPVLKAGDILLITLDGQKEPPRYVRSVGKVEGIKNKQGKQTRTRVYLEKTQVPDDAVPVLENPLVYMFMQQSALFGRNAPEWASLPLKQKELTATPKGGVYISTNQGSNWQIASVGMPQQPIRALALDDEGCMMAGGSKGAYRSLDGGKSWQSANAGMNKRDVYCLYFDDAGHLYAGCAQGGAYRSTDKGKSWDPIQDGLVVAKEHDVKRHFKSLNTRVPRTTIRALISYTEAKDKNVYTLAGTDMGILRSVNQENVWEPAGNGLPGWNDDAGTAHTVVHCFVMHPKGSPVFAGTDHGVFSSDNHGKSWKALNNGLDFKEVLSMAAVEIPDSHKHLIFFHNKPKHFLFTGTSKGLYLSLDDGDTWQPTGAELTPGKQGLPVRSLLLYKEIKDKNTIIIRLFAATDMGIFLSVDLGQSWESTSTGLDSPDVLTMTGNKAGLLTAAVPFDGVIETEWPQFTIKDNQVDLTQARPGILPYSPILLLQDAPQPLLRCCRAVEVSQTIRRDFGRSARVTRIQTDSCSGLEDFSLREASVYVQAKRLPLFREKIPVSEIVSGTSLKLKGIVTGLKADQYISVSQSVPTTDKVVARDIHPEFHRLAGPGSPAADGTYTEILLQEELQYKFPVQQVVICANVAYAVQGETVSHEIIGSGNMSQGNQSFTLKKPPLTYVSDKSSDGARSTLHIRVNSGPPHSYMEMMQPNAMTEKGIPWQETDSLYGSGPNDRVYMVRTDDKNIPTVIFGNGTQGALLPTGVENVSATYRSGSGAYGNVAADQLKILKSRVLGLQKVTNPLPAVGGKDQETTTAARRNAPGTVRTLQRIVSISDYYDFTVNFAGIDKAFVKRIWNGSIHLVHITVAAAGGFATAGNLIDNLQAAITSFRDKPVPMAIAVYEAVRFNLALKVILKPAAVRDLDAASIEKLVYAQLQFSFNFNNRTLGQSVSDADIMVALSCVPGVRAVYLEALYFAGTPVSLNQLLPAQTTRVENGSILPAQLLTISDEQDAVRLTMETGESL